MLFLCFWNLLSILLLQTTHDVQEPAASQPTSGSLLQTPALANQVSFIIVSLTTWWKSYPDNPEVSIPHNIVPAKKNDLNICSIAIKTFL